jgi:hypothetical protein
MPAIKPSEVIEYKKEKVIPEYVFDAFNFLIAKNFSSKSSRFTQDWVVSEILKRSPEGVTREYLFDNHFLDIEDIYRDAGWCVEYDKPAYCESYSATFEFKCLD